jgi:hypothetical protein
MVEAAVLRPDGRQDLVAVMRKLLGIIHALVRDDRDYAANYSASKRRMIKKAA